MKPFAAFVKSHFSVCVFLCGALNALPAFASSAEVVDVFLPTEFRQAAPLQVFHDARSGTFAVGDALDAKDKFHWIVRRSPKAGEAWSTVDQIGSSTDPGITQAIPHSGSFDHQGNLYISGQIDETSGASFHIIRKFDRASQKWSNAFREPIIQKNPDGSSIAVSLGFMSMYRGAHDGCINLITAVGRKTADGKALEPTARMLSSCDQGRTWRSKWIEGLRNGNRSISINAAQVTREGDVYFAGYELPQGQTKRSAFIYRIKSTRPMSPRTQPLPPHAELVDLVQRPDAFWAYTTSLAISPRGDIWALTVYFVDDRFSNYFFEIRAKKPLENVFTQQEVYHYPGNLPTAAESIHVSPFDGKVIVNASANGKWLSHEGGPTPGVGGFRNNPEFLALNERLGKSLWSYSAVATGPGAWTQVGIAAEKWIVIETK